MHIKFISNRLNCVNWQDPLGLLTTPYVTITNFTAGNGICRHFDAALECIVSCFLVKDKTYYVEFCEDSLDTEINI